MILTNIKELMPEFFKAVDNGIIHLYDHYGFTRELTQIMKDKIKELEQEADLKVIAVTEGTYIFPGDDKAHMVAYIYTEKDYQPWHIEDNVVGFMAYVVNDSWDIEESGSIGLVETLGLVRRVY